MSSIKYEYHYNGPVLYFDRILTNTWEGTTVAASRSRALANFSYQFKKEAKLGNSAKVTLIGKYLTEGDAIMK